MSGAKAVRKASCGFLLMLFLCDFFIRLVIHDGLTRGFVGMSEVNQDSLLIVPNSVSEWQGAKPFRGPAALEAGSKQLRALSVIDDGMRRLAR